MTDITPADLAKFVHRVPVGATIPAGVDYALRFVTGRIGIETDDYDHEVTDKSFPRWTAEPIPAPEPTLAERARGLAASVDRNTDTFYARLAAIVADLAERIEAKP